MVDDGAWQSYKLTLGSGELKLITTWHSLTPDPASSVGGGGGGGGYRVVNWDVYSQHKHTNKYLYRCIYHFSDSTK